MADYLYPVGQIIQGDYDGCYVYNYDSNSFEINTKSRMRKFLGSYNSPETRVRFLNTKDIDRIVDVASSQSGPDVASVVRGVAYAGAVGGLVGAVASQSSTNDIAVYLKNKEKFIIRFNNANAVNKIRTMTFKL